MFRSWRVLAMGGKQMIFGLGKVCIETILFHLVSLFKGQVDSIQNDENSETIHVFELYLFQFKSHLNLEMQ